MNTTFPEYLTTPQAAEYVGMSRQWFDIARVKGDGPPFVKIGRAVRYHRPTLDKWLKARERNHTVEGASEGAA